MNDHTPAFGHNNPPPFDADQVAALDAKAREIADAVGAWADLGEITTDEQAQMLTDFVSGATAVEKQIETARTAAKKPHADAGKAVDEAFKRPAAIVDRAKTRAKQLLTGFLQAQARRQAEERARQAAEATRIAEEAQRAAAIAVSNNDVAGQIEAEERAKEAAHMAKAAASATNAKVGSFTGAGRTIALRKTKHAKVENQNAAYMYFAQHPDVARVIQQLATQAIRAGEIVPGCTMYELETAA